MERGMDKVKELYDFYTQRSGRMREIAVSRGLYWEEQGLWLPGKEAIEFQNKVQCPPQVNGFNWWCTDVLLIILFDLFVLSH